MAVHYKQVSFLMLYFRVTTTHIVTNSTELMGLFLQAARVTKKFAGSSQEKERQKSAENAQFIPHKFSNCECLSTSPGMNEKGMESVMLMNTMAKEGNILGNPSSTVP